MGDCKFARQLAVYGEESGFVAFGVHVDFGAAIFLKNVNFTDIPGPCIKLVNGRSRWTGVFISVREYPIIIASRGFVRVVACTTLCRPVINRRVHILLRTAQARTRRGVRGLSSSVRRRPQTRP